MSNCVAAIQFDKEKQRFVLVSGSNRVEIRKTKALTKFVKESPDISFDILAALKDQWFPEDDVAEYQEIVDQTDVLLVEDEKPIEAEVIEHAG